MGLYPGWSTLHQLLLSQKKRGEGWLAVCPRHRARQGL